MSGCTASEAHITDTPSEEAGFTKENLFEGIDYPEKKRLIPKSGKNPHSKDRVRLKVAPR